ncbi:MAG: class I tRNA ligase family protein, partial [Patescibacteria group bacterium]
CDVLHPQGFDSFGLPAENYAIKTGTHPKETTAQNIENYIRQMKSLGFGYDFGEKIITSSPEYYKWTQWLFTQFFEHGLVYKKTASANWCDSCKTVLANEQVVDGKCERCKNEVTQKEVPGWFFKITDFADGLIEGLKGVDWPEHTKKNQINWIGKSEGALIKFPISSSQFSIEVFTTRPDTLFGAMYMALAPEHEMVSNLKKQITNWDEVEKYVNDTKKKTERERVENKEKTGVELKGIRAINPANNEEIPVFIADYVLAHYGTGAIMAVPAHDERDWKFAAKFNLPKPPVVEPYFVKNGGEDGVRDDKQTIEREAITAIVKHWTEDKYIVLKWKKVDWHTFITGGVENGQTPEEAARAEVLEETGYKDIKNASELSRFHSKFFHVPKDENRLAHFHTFYFELGSGEREIVSTDEQKHHEVLWLMPEETVKVLTPPGHLYVWNELKNGTSAYLGEGILANSEKFDGMGSEEAKKAITDFVGGTMTNTYRLRDWSISRQRYWGAPIPVVYDSNGSPHIVPEKYLPWLLPEDVDFVPTGTAPLAKSEELKKRTEEIFGKGWTPETDTMDTFVCSSWYYLRYPNPHNENMFCSGERLRRWLPVDLYIGGAEHTYMHLLYARFFTRAMRKIGLIDFDEPFLKLRHQGMVLDKNGVKMSKSKGNVVNPDEITERFGADAVRLYMMFAGPLDEDVMWNENGIVGTYRFLEKVWRLSQMCADSAGRKTETLLHKTIKKVEGDIEELKFNTAISAMMIFVNTAEKEGITQKQYEAFLKLLAPFAPHMTEELWCELGYVASIHLEKFPIADPAHSKDEERVIAVQIDGKTRDTFTVPQDADDKAIEEMAVSREMVKKWLNGKTISRIIVAKGKIVSIVTER